MERIDIINNFCKMLIINTYVYFMILVILGYKGNTLRKTFEVVFLSVIIAIVFSILIQKINQIFIIPVIYFLYTFVIKSLTKQTLNYCLIIANLSMVMTYILYFGSALVSGIILMIIDPNIKYNNPISLILISFIMLGIFYCLFKIKRLKNGINFIKNIEKNHRINIFINIITILVFTTFIAPNKIDNIILNTLLTSIIIFLIISVIYWIRSQITKYYKKNMRDRTIEVQRKEIEEHKIECQELKEENIKLAEAVHKYNNRLSAVEMALENAINKSTNSEFSNELSVILDDTKEISKNFSKESETIKHKLPNTNISGIDNMFKYMQKEALESNIDFDLKLNSSINDLIDKIIPKDRFETLLGDHLRDAIIAINFSNSTYRSILVTLGIVENCYELSIYDTGIEFEIDTLLKLGKERITTHKDTGGNGIGFMTTFETLKETKASLFIEEYNPENLSYSKSVNIRFDGKAEYCIYSYRAEKIKKENKDKNIIIKDI